MEADDIPNIDVSMAKMEMTRSPNKLTALGIGSCIVITLYDPVLKAGALAHPMLPDSTKSEPSENPIKYADLAIDVMIKKLGSIGSRRKDLEAKIVGGADMFPNIGEGVETGEANVLAVKEKLKREGIRLTGEATGGSTGRSVEFDLTTGIVTIKIKI